MRRLLQSGFAAAVAFALIPAAYAQGPILVMNYVLDADQNVVPLVDGDILSFHPTLVGTVAEASFNITNVGTSPGTVVSLSITGAAFRFSGIPLFPATIPAGQTFRVRLLYTPLQTADLDAGRIVVSFAGNAAAFIQVQGRGIAPALTYKVETQPPADIPPGGTVNFPGTSVGSASQLLFHVENRGSSSGVVNSLSLAGAAYQLENLPVLPLTLNSGSAMSFVVTFRPTTAGRNAGTLTINSDRLNLTGDGLAPLLSYSYIANGVTTVLPAQNPAIVYSPLVVSQSADILLQIRNSGTAQARIASIGISQGAGVFAIPAASLPPMPFTLGAGEQIELTVRFTPSTVGFASGALLVDTFAISLLGQGTEPPTLPAISISGPSGNVAPGTQPFIGISLASPYPVAIAGTLNLDVGSGNLPADPAVQFATGGRTVSFEIPANTTTALFPGRAQTIGLQTGTVASTIRLTPVFRTQGGNVDLTPTGQTSLEFQVPVSAPVLLTAQISSITGDSLILTLTGFATNRDLTGMTLQFTPAPGISISNPQLRIDLRPAAALWFPRTTSHSFGGQFTLSLPLAFRAADLDSDRTPVGTISTIAATVESGAGTSSSVQVAIP